MKRRLECDQGASTSKGDSEVPTDSKRTYQGQSIKNVFTILDGSFKDVMRHKYPKDKSNRHCYSQKTKWDKDIYNIHMEFLHAGANMIRSNTTTAFYSIISQLYALRQTTYEELIRKNFVLALNAVNDYMSKPMEEGQREKGAYVVGSVGHLDRTEGMSNENRRNEYRLLIQALSRAGACIFCLEDIQSTEDAIMLVELLNELKKEGISVFMMFKLNSQGSFEDGTDWTQTAHWCCEKLNIYAIGINCLYPKDAKAWLERLQGQLRNLPRTHYLILCTNKVKNNPNWYPFGVISDESGEVKIMSPVDCAALDVRYIGGCCHTHPKDIKQISEELQKYNGSSN